MMSIIKDKNLAKAGKMKIEWVRQFMPVLSSIKDEYRNSLKGQTIAIVLHLEAKTAYLAEVLKDAGANVVIAGSNPLSTQDDIAAALDEYGVEVFATHACTKEEYTAYLNKLIDKEPSLFIDDGGDFVAELNKRFKHIKPSWLIGGSEETTTGITRLKLLEQEKRLAFPMVAANNSYCKYLFDNRYGTGQSVWTAIMQTTNTVIAGKVVVIAGYGWCGKGAALRAKGLGAKVIITEVDPIKAVEAVFDGFYVMPMEKAAKLGDIFLTVTGDKNVIRYWHYVVMKDNVILANAGHFNVEFNLKELMDISIDKYKVRENVECYKLADGHKIYVLAEGRLINLASGDGHPAEIMDLSFAVQYMSIFYLLKNRDLLENKVYELPYDTNLEIAKLKLKTSNIYIDELTKEQREYLGL